MATTGQLRIANSVGTSVPRRRPGKAPNVLGIHALALALILSSCGQPTETQRTVHEVTGDRAHRVEQISKQLARKHAVPSPLLDAHQFVLQLGDGVFGPSDYVSYTAIEVEKGTVDRWTELLTPLTEVADFAEPTEPRPWWVSAEEFGKLTFYRGHPFAPFLHGWIGVARDRGRLYIFSYSI